MNPRLPFSLEAGTLGLCLGVIVWQFQDSFLGRAENSLLFLSFVLLYLLLPSCRIKANPEPWPLTAAVAGPLLILLGLSLEILVLAAVGFSLLGALWLVRRLTPRPLSFPRIFIFLILAFPWLEHDFQQIGWAFRLTAASLTEHLFSALGLLVFRQGVHLYINGIQMEIASACAGLATLQFILLAGVYLAAVRFPRETRFWVILLVAIPFAWLANFSRIVLFTVVSLLVSVEFVTGPFHDWAGLLVVVGYLAVFYALLQALPPRLGSRPDTAKQGQTP